jgi:hypothetical protein
MSSDTRTRAGLRIAQTPQAFRFDVILDAHRRAARDGRSDFTDDAALAEWAGLTVATFEGDPANMKLTRLKISSARKPASPPSSATSGPAPAMTCTPSATAII